ncbi:agouti-signaling protein 2b isoform X2 [Denticeps clupeoides]|uniref:agouti-signaling protein 2b isoform X2 n=1 Tax=Denticeps clupeoides TaxID=299321 RepID=UPI0010A31639|nr:agouti-signaling protein-like isoform X2 [Denticeps clupeoides]
MELHFLLCVFALAASGAAEIQPQQPGFWHQDKPRRLFARARLLSHQKLPLLKPKVPAPLRRCPALTEPCVPGSACCDPCAVCHCHLFKTVCHCLGMSRGCPKHS